MSKIDVTELDFASIKAALKDYLSDQAEFEDFNFEGSAINILLDILAYNTHYMGMNAHLLYNESFIDSAAKRSSVVSLAGHLNYTPKSITAARAVVDITITPEGEPTSIAIPKYTQFSSILNGTNYVFITLQEYTAEPDGEGNYVAKDVELVQGTNRAFVWTVNTSDADQKFSLPFANVDTSCLSVVVQTSSSDTTQETYTFVDSILDLDGTDRVYFLKENDNGKFEIIFGDDILGKAVVDGNIIIINYLITDGEVANQANVFTPANTISGYTGAVVTTVQAAYGGAPPEDIEEIRKLAPLFYESQGRAVTANDYKSILLNNISIVSQNFESISVWGGEENVPPKYGNVFISLKPKDGVLVTTFLKNRIINEVLSQTNVVGIIPEIVDPEYLELDVTCRVNYAKNRTTMSKTEIETAVKQTIKDYRDTALSFFDSNFRYSDLTVLVENTNSAIENNLIDISMKRAVDVVLNTAAMYDIYFYNAIEKGSLSSTLFYMMQSGNSATDTYYLTDDRVGNVVLWRKRADATTSIVNATFGTIDYTTGHINLPNFVPVNLIDSETFYIHAIPEINNLDTVRNLIITYDNADITVTATGIVV